MLQSKLDEIQLSILSSFHVLRSVFFSLCVDICPLPLSDVRGSLLVLLSLEVLEEIKTLRPCFSPLFSSHNRAEGTTANPPQIKQHKHTHARL